MAVLGLASLMTSCGSTSGRSASGPGAAIGSRASVYFVSETKGWKLRKAYKPRPDDPVTSRAEPSLDWYAEHERYPDPSSSRSVRLSGHDAPIAQLEGTLAGFELRARTVHGLTAKAGSSPDGPRVVLLPVASDYTVMTLSYELSLDELIEWSNALQAVDEVG